MLDVVYSLAVQDTKEAREARQRLDDHLLSLVVSNTPAGKPDRATWGRLPHQQAAMKAAQTADG
jgi:hydroxypyruvate isomerase